MEEFGEFEDDFIDDDDDDEENESDSNEKTQENSEDQKSEADPNSSKISQKLEDDDDKNDNDDDDTNLALPKEVAEDVNDVFSRSEKLDSLSMSLKFANTVTNRLYSLLYCINQDTELLITRNRSNSPINLQSEAIKANNPNIKFDSGIIKHKKFVDGFNCNTLKAEKDQQELYNYLELCRNSIGKALPSIVKSSCQILKDPLVRSHNTYKAIKQKISDLKKANNELSVQTRHTANRLVKLSKSEGESASLEPTTTNSDIIILQQRLQKILTRVYNLRESNEATQTSNTELQKKIAEEASKSPNKDSKKLNENVLNLQKKIAELTADIEQFEDERETVMAQRRVSLSRMNASIEKVNAEIKRDEALLFELENKVRLMTQGQHGAKSPPSGSNSSLSEKKPNRQLKQAAGSKIPVLQQRPR